MYCLESVYQVHTFVVYLQQSVKCARCKYALVKILNSLGLDSWWLPLARYPNLNFFVGHRHVGLG